MKNFLLIIGIIFLFSCKKEDISEPTTVQYFPVEYYLSPDDKALFNFFYTNKTITFSDSNNVQIQFQADSLYNILTYREGDLRTGEMLQLQYKCLSNYFPNYTINLSLTAKQDNKVDLNILFATGTYANNQNNDYVLSGFWFNPKAQYDLDSINPHGGIIKYFFEDSLQLRNITFYDVFYSTNELINTSHKQTKMCYYSINEGIVGFINNDSKFWVRNN
jgi:hypothetical protein